MPATVDEMKSAIRKALADEALPPVMLSLRVRRLLSPAKVTATTIGKAVSELVRAGEVKDLRGSFRLTKKAVK